MALHVYMISLKVKHCKTVVACHTWYNAHCMIRILRITVNEASLIIGKSFCVLSSLLQDCICSILLLQEARHQGTHTISFLWKCTADWKGIVLCLHCECRYCYVSCKHNYTHAGSTRILSANDREIWQCLWVRIKCTG